MDTRLIILTSRKNYIWVSMEEIITWIENSWEAWSIQKKISYKIINVDDFGFNNYVKEALTSDLIIVTCFNTSIASFLSPLRKKLGINTPWVFYLHGLASFGSWPIFKWKMGDSLNSSDTFIGSCERDKKQFELIFKNISCRVIPFSLLEENPIPLKEKGKKLKLAFIGRISSQKNLHSLILALSVLKNSWKESEWEMHFFGKEDNYGSPLMGRSESGYQAILQKLSEDEKLTEHIQFHGFVQRIAIEKMMDDEQWVFIAPSIHSDENFGMAAFRCLIRGHRVILSDWGGHHDFKKEFDKAVTLLPVYKSPIGPFIDILQMAQSIKNVIHSTTRVAPLDYPAYYSQNRLFSHFDSIWNKILLSESEVKTVETTPLLDEVLNRREYFLTHHPPANGSRIFYDYEDSLKDAFFDSYGQLKNSHSKISDKTKLSPWVKETEQSFEVDDPHRGQFSLLKSLYDKDQLKTMGLTWPA